MSIVRFGVLGIAAAAAFVLAGTDQASAQARMTQLGSSKFNFAAEPWSLDRKWMKAEVNYRTTEKPGTVIIETRKRYLYLVMPNGKALRYGIGVGREGFKWYGSEKVSRKAEWPAWTPPPEMRKREPHLPVSMPGGPDNPLGARAMYLGATEYRIHGTAQPWTIGTSVSSGCIRLTNDDVTDLYERVKVGAKVIVR